MHGARAGAPKGNKNALKHGEYSADAIRQRKSVSELIERSRKVLEVLN